MKWRGFDKEKDEITSSLCEVGEILSQKLHDRVRWLCGQIGNLDGITLDHLNMGMGGWSFGRKSLMKFAEGDTRDFDDYMNGGPGGAGIEEGPEWEQRWPKLPKLAKELEEILMYLTDEHYLTLLDIDEAEMKKLVDIQ
jgi:hypothetical protein